MKKEFTLRISMATVLSLIALAAVSFAFYRFPGLDEFLARQLYLGHGKFLLSDSKLAEFFHGPVDMVLKLGFLVSFVVYLGLCAVRFKIAPELHRKLIFVFSTVFISELVIVNWLLKNHWGRARPVQLGEFGSNTGAHFTPAWQKVHECMTNCSFSSGHAGIAACVGLLAVFLPPRWRPLYLVLTLIFVVVVDFMRMARGAHYLSDVVVSPLIVLATAMVVKDLLRLRTHS